MKNEKGFTLVEILASVVILFIILITFFGFFTQSAILTRTNQESLQATNLANQVMELLRSRTAAEIELLTDDSALVGGSTEQELRDLLGINEENQFIEYSNLALKIGFETTSASTDTDTESLGLRNVKIEIIQRERDAVLATRYFFVEGTSEE